MDPKRQQSFRRRCLHTGAHLSLKKVGHITKSLKTWSRLTQPLDSILSQIHPVHTPYPISPRSILILLSHICRSLPSGLIHSCFPTKIFYSNRIPQACYMPRSSHSSGIDHRNSIWWSVQVMKLLIMQSSPASRHFLTLRYKYSPQHPVFKNPQIYTVILNYCRGFRGL
jgi:hypothetical protein